MLRPRLLEWQWSDYSAKHRNRANLLVHIVAVPLFQSGTVTRAYAAIRVSAAAGALAAACMVATLLAQGRGHRLERETPTPVDGPAHFVRRFAGVRGGGRESAPEVVGISVRNIDNVVLQRPAWHLAAIDEIVATLRQESRARIVLGGPAISILGAAALARGDADFAA